MKKKSILLTCIVAIMALAMFVGCDNAPTLPSFVVSGRIDQIGDILSGQAFDASKFSVTVTYDNGRIVAADETVSVMLNKDEGNTVEAGDEVIAYVGKNYESQDVYAKASVKVYNLSSITVEGPASVVLGDKLTNSDFTVTANYGEGKTMVLDSTEFTVGDVEYANDVKPTAANPSVKATVTVIPSVGNKEFSEGVWAVSEDFTFDCTYEATGELPGPVEGINIALKKDAGQEDIEVNVPAMEDVYPSYDDFAITFDIAGMDEPYAPVADPGVVLTYVDEYLEDLEGDLSGLTATSTIYVKVEYEDFVEYLKLTSTNMNVNEPELVITPSAAFEVENSYTAGSTLPQLSSTGLSGVLTVGEKKTKVSAEDLEVAFYDGSESIITKAPATGEMYVRVSYRGVLSDSIKNVKVSAAPTVASIKSVKLVDGFSLVKQQYTAIPSALSAIESITVVMNDTAKTEVVIPAADFEDEGVSAVYTTNAAGSAFEGKNDLSSATSLFVMAKYETFTAYAQVKLEDAVIDKLVVAVDLGKNVDVALYGGKVTLEPSITTTTNGTLAVTLNELEFVDTATNKYVDSTTKTALIADDGVTLDEKEHAYKAVLVKDGELIESEEFVIPAGISYINIAEEAIASGFKVEATSAYYPLIDDPISVNTDFYKATVKTESGDSPVKAPSGETPEINVDEIVIPDGQVVEGTNTNVYARISYVGPEGKTVSGLVKVESFKGNAYVEATDASLKVMYTDPETGVKTEITQFNKGSVYVVDKLSVEGYVNHGSTEPNLVITDQWNGTNVESSGNLRLDSSTYTFTITFTGFDAEANTVKSGMTAAKTITVV